MRPKLAVLAAVAVAALLVTSALCQRKAAPVYVGCFIDKYWPDRDLLGLVGIAQLGPFSVSYTSQGILTSSSMTVELCCEICTYGGFRYAALQNHAECACDSTYGSWGSAPEADCGFTCAGNALQKCGGYLRISIYENVYSPASRGLRFRKVATSDAPPLVTTAEFVGALGWDSSAQSLVECAASCSRAASCSAYRFNGSSGLCRLSSFATAISGESGDIWIVG